MQMPHQNPGYPQKPKNTAKTVLLVILGVVATGMLGVFALCVGAVKKAGRDAEVAAASAKASAEKEGAVFVPLLAKLASDPKSLSPKAAKPGKDVTVYTYDDPKGTPLHGLTMTVGKTPHAWLIDFTAESGVAPNDFAPGGIVMPAPAEDGSELHAVNDGVLKNAVLRHDQAQHRWQLMSANHALHEMTGGHKTLVWICDTARAEGVNTVETSAFKSQCEDMVRAKLLSPKSAEFPGIFDSTIMITGNTCNRTWQAWVEATNAFNARIRRTFACSFDANTNRVNLTMN